jgi:hypothetical protein
MSSNTSQDIEIQIVHTSAAAVFTKYNPLQSKAHPAIIPNTVSENISTLVLVLNNAHTITEESMTHSLDQTR